MRSETIKNLDLSNEKHALIHIYWEWMDWNQEKRAFETEWAPWTPDAMILKSWIILHFWYFRSPCCWYSLFFPPKHDASHPHYWSAFLVGWLQPTWKKSSLRIIKAQRTWCFKTQLTLKLPCSPWYPLAPTGPPGEFPLHRGRPAASGMVPTLPGPQTPGLGGKCLDGWGEVEMVIYPLVNIQKTSPWDIAVQNQVGWAPKTGSFYTGVSLYGWTPLGRVVILYRS